MVRRSTHGLMLGFLIACGSREAANVGTQACSPAAQKADRPASYRAMVYSAAFAERFSLPTGGVQPLDAGLHAVALRVLERAGDTPRCRLDFYLEDSLDVAYPEGSEGVFLRPDDEDPFFFVSDYKLLGPENHRWDPQLGSFHALACRKTPQSCMLQEGPPYAFVRHLVPGVALQTYEVLCSAFDPKHGPTEMWILRAGHDAKDLNPGSTNESATYRFAVPTALFDHAAARTRQAMQVYEDSPLPRQPSRGQFTVPDVK